MKYEHAQLMTKEGAQLLLDKLIGALNADDDVFDEDVAWRDAISYDQGNEDPRDDLESLIISLDEAEDDYGDFFGTEGWRHRYNM